MRIKVLTFLILGSLGFIASTEAINNQPVTSISKAGGGPTATPQPTATPLPFTFTNDGNAGATPAVPDFDTAGPNHTITINATITSWTWVAPGAGDQTGLTIKLVHEASASVYTITWPVLVKWPGGGTKISNTNTSGAIDIVFCKWDGTNYFCSGNPNYSFFEWLKEQFFHA